MTHLDVTQSYLNATLDALRQMESRSVPLVALESEADNGTPILVVTVVGKEAVDDTIRRLWDDPESSAVDLEPEPQLPPANRKLYPGLDWPNRGKLRLESKTEEEPFMVS